MKTKNIICFGFGQVAKNFIKKLNDQGIPFKLTTTSREESTNKKFEKISYESFQFTEEGFDKNFISKFEEADHILLRILTPDALVFHSDTDHLMHLHMLHLLNVFVD